MLVDWLVTRAAPSSSSQMPQTWANGSNSKRMAKPQKSLDRWNAHSGEFPRSCVALWIRYVGMHRMVVIFMEQPLEPRQASERSWSMAWLLLMRKG